jgi:hypothetical protein
MIAQRKPNQDKGFEDFHGSQADIARKLQFLPFAIANRGLKPSVDGAWRWFLPTSRASFSPPGELRALAVTFDPLFRASFPDAHDRSADPRRPRLSRQRHAFFAAL